MTNTNYKALTKRIKVSVHELLLDPNNPRLINQSNHDDPVMPDNKAEGKQESLLKLFSNALDHGDEAFVDISDLKKSMKTVGFQDIDSIVIRKLDGESKKYLVIEGNRRVATMKTLIEEDAKVQYGESEVKDELKDKFKDHKAGFENLPVQLLDPWNEESISTILGLRHFGSVKDWPPYARAKHAYRRYMELELPSENLIPLDTFELANKRSKKLQEELAVGKAEVETSLKTYVVFKQIGEVEPKVSSLDYQLIQSSLKLKGSFLNQDPVTFLLDEPSMGKLLALLQFDIRSEHRKDPRLVIPGDEALRDFGKILKYKAGELPKGAPDNATVEEKATQLISQLLTADLDEEGALLLSVSTALERIQTISQHQLWVHIVQEFLEGQKENLPFDDYAGSGNDKLKKDELKVLGGRHLRSMDLPLPWSG